MHDIIILGSGPAGLTAALYCARGGKKTLVIGGDILGGQTSTIAVLENYPGFQGTGLELSELMKKQATSFGAELIMASVKSVHGDVSQGFTIKTLDDKEHKAKVIILATGASPRKLDIKGAKELFGKGVSYCATCDGFFCAGQDVIVVGGGNSAINDALYMSDLAKTVKIIYRQNEFARAEKILVDRLEEKENVQCLFNTELKSLKQDPETLGGLIATTDKGLEIKTSSVFVAIGHEANTDYLSENIKRDELGRISQKTLPDGMFVAGDVMSGMKMQIATAVGSGCEAAMNAIAYINSNGL